MFLRGLTLAQGVSMRCHLLQPGLIEVRYDAPHEFDASNDEVLALLRRQVAQGATSIVFDLGEMTKLSPRVPNYWLDCVSDLGPNLVAVGVVSHSLVVRAVIGAFAMASSLRKQHLEVEVFDEPHEAATWARRQLPGARLFAVPAGGFVTEPEPELQWPVEA
jgi:hypothetical protein